MYKANIFLIVYSTQTIKTWSVEEFERNDKKDASVCPKEKTETCFVNYKISFQESYEDHPQSQMVKKARPHKASCGSNPQTGSLKNTGPKCLCDPNPNRMEKGKRRDCGMTTTHDEVIFPLLLALHTHLESTWQLTKTRPHKATVVQIPNPISLKHARHMHECLRSDGLENWRKGIVVRSDPVESTPPPSCTYTLNHEYF